MGFNLFGSSSESKTENLTTENNLVETVNRNVSGNTGLVATEGSNITTIDKSIHVATDYGAIQGATGLAENALEAVSAANRASLDSAAVIADQSLKSVGSAYGQALTAVSENADNTSTIVSKLATTFGTQLGDLYSGEQAQLGNTVSALNSLFVANAKSSDANVVGAAQSAQDTVANVVKYIALAAAVAFVGFIILKKA